MGMICLTSSSMRMCDYKVKTDRHLTTSSEQNDPHGINYKQRKQTKQQLLTEQYRSTGYYLFDKHVSSNLTGRHILDVHEELGDPVSDDRKERHEIFDNLYSLLIIGMVDKQMRTFIIIIILCNYLTFLYCSCLATLEWNTHTKI